MDNVFSTIAGQFLGDYRKEFQEFTPFPAIQDRAFYTNLDPELAQSMIKAGESYLGYQYPAILATDFMRFKRDGNRVAFENVYFAKRHALCGLVLAECVEDQGRFLDDIINGIFSICEESAWQLPPHNSYYRNQSQSILPDLTDPVIELFSCETGALLSCVSYVMKERLDAFSPFILKRINAELQHRILTPYLTKHFWWMGYGDEPMCNWTPWCTQNVLLTAFLSSTSSEQKKQIVRKAALSLDYFLKDYGIDGCCDEGPQYYRHAGLCLYGAMEILNTVMGNCLDAVFQEEKIKHIAAYILNVHADDKYYINFADASAVAGRCGTREYLFGKATHQPDLMRYASRDYKIEKGRLFTDEVNQINLYYQLQNLYYRNEVLSYDDGAVLSCEDTYYPSVGLFLTRNEHMIFAAKAGDNDDNHNHNDTGSFILYKDGNPLFVDIGVESYTAKTFSDRRYEIWTMQSCYHNLPTLAGIDQKEGAAYKATNTSYQFDEKTAVIKMELASAYPLSQGSYVREYQFDKTRSILTIHDVTDISDAVLHFITYEKPQPCSESCLQIGTISKVSFSGATLDSIEVLPITDPRLQKAWDHDLYRINLKLNASDFLLTIE